MKLSNVFVTLFSVAALSACAEKNGPELNGPDDNGGRFLAVEISNPASRADIDGEYEEGSGDEHAINSLRFYFFNGAGEAVKVSVSGTTNFVDCSEIVPEDKDMENVEKKLQAIVVINTANGGSVENVQSMVAVANYDDAGLGSGSLSLSELQAKVGDYGAVEKGGKANFMMTSSSYAGADGQVNEVHLKPENLCKSEDEAKLHPVDVYIERVVAKARLSVADGLGSAVTYGGKQCTAVALKDTKGSDIMYDGKQVNAILTGWNLTGTADKSYLLKNVNTTAKWDLGWAWNNSDYFRSYWAMNPADVKLGYIPYTDITLGLGEDAAAYCLENAADVYESGTKSDYDPSTELSNRTQVIVAGVLATVDNGVATPIDLAKWAGGDYTAETVVTAMLNTVSTQIYTKEGDKFVSIKPGHVELVPAEDAGTADNTSEGSPRYLSALRLKDNVTVQFYSAPSEANAITPDQVNGILKTIPGARVWESGLTYYYADIKHLGAERTKGLYGVVRNHVYDIKVNSVVGLGTPVYDPDEVIIPEKPGDDETYIAAKINILSWRIVPNDVDFAW